MPDMPPLARRRFGLGLAATLLGAGAAPALLTGCATVPAAAQRTLPDFADLSERVLPAVVNIAVTTEVSSADLPPELRDLPAERFPRGRPRGRRREMIGAGSGFLIDPAGYVATNSHVVGRAVRVLVSLQDGSEYPARLVGTDELTDLAVLKIDPRPGVTLASVPWGSSARLRIGEWVLVAGNPFGLGATVTAGIVSARGRQIGAGPFDDFIQTDAAINLGNSGGPLFNTAGQVVGISTAIYTPSGVNAGVGFAIPSDLARPLIERLMREGRVDRGWLGVSVEDAAAVETETTGGLSGRGAAGRGALPPGARRGALIAGVERNGPAARGGLRPGDLVVTVNGERVETSQALVRSIAALPPGETVQLGVVRDGREREVAVQVGRRPAQPGG